MTCIPMATGNLEKTEEKPHQKSRGGRKTEVTSVSISKEFRTFMEDYNISPSEAVKKGVAIVLFERGLPQYKSELNEKRYQALQEVAKKGMMTDLVEKIKTVEMLLKEIRFALEL